MTVRVQVLLSTFNGEAYLDEQLASLFAQEGVELRVSARDDGSNDNTLVLLEQASRGDARLTVSSGPNLGVVGSFFDLMRSADDECEYFAFCDQDDVWLPEKLVTAVRKIEHLRTEEPRLYFSRLRYADAKLADLGLSSKPRNLSFSSALVENVATGCTVVFDRELLRMARKNLDSEHCLMHDWWLYLLALSSGSVVYDREPHLLYRQHGGNAVGGSANFFARYRSKFRRFVKREAAATHLTDQARAFWKSYRGVMRPDARVFLEAFLRSKLTFRSRLRWAFRLPTRRQAFLDNCILRILIVLGRY